MYQTEKKKIENLVTWTEYEPATQEPRGNWKANGIGRIRFKHEDGHTFLAETDAKVAYGRTAEEAVEGVLRRVNAQVGRIVASMLECQKEREPTAL